MGGNDSLSRPTERKEEMSTVLESLEAFVRASRPDFENTLREITEIQTISMDPSHKEDVLRGAEKAKQIVESMGGTAEIVETGGNRAVIAKFGSLPHAKTISVYNHLDVQPANEPEWVREPFRFQVEGDKYYARGATDDKGPAMTVLFAANYAMLNNIPVNINFIWEFEEEIGSPNFENLITKRKAELKSDVIVVSDTLWLDRTKPAITYGLRGLQGVTLHLETGTNDAHSGVTGGAARNPIGELAQLISQLYNAKTGKVKIPHFYDDVIPLKKKEIDNFLASGFKVSDFQRVHGLKSMRTKKPAEVLTRIWGMPTLEVHGIVGGYTGPGVKTVVPPRAEAKISMRLVPNQSPKKVLKLLTGYVKKLNPDVKVKPHSTLGPYLGDFSGSLAKATSDAVEFAFGKKPAFIREGGSIGAVVTMAKHLKAPITIIGLSLPEHGYHAPNEYFDFGQYAVGVKTFVKFFDTVSRM